MGNLDFIRFIAVPYCLAYIYTGSSEATKEKIRERIVKKVSSPALKMGKFEEKHIEQLFEDFDGMRDLIFALGERNDLRKKVSD